MDVISQIRLAKWSLRKLRLGIDSNALVLDVGSGGNPHPRADVLLEKYTSGFHRHGDAAVVDRPTVFGDACAMPFRDKAFDFVIAFHVLEHMRCPEKFLHELQRVGKAGYIETPNVVFERLVPYDVHLLEIMDLEGRLYIQKKAQRATDPFMQQLALHQRSRTWHRSMYGNPEAFHVRFFWRNTIPFEIVNPEETCDWFRDPPISTDDTPIQALSNRGWRRRGLAGLRKWRTWRQVNKVSLPDLLACPSCRAALSGDGQVFVCEGCGAQFRADPYPDFNEPLLV